MSRRAIILAVLLSWCGTVGLYAQDDKPAFTADLYGGIYINNEQAWQLEPSVSWLFHKYLGVALGLELTSQYNQPNRQTTIDGQEAELTDNERNIRWFIFKPSVVLKSSTIWKNSDNDYRLWLQIEPGVSLACPFRNSLTYEIKEFAGSVSQTVDYRRFPNKGLRWFYWNARASVNFSIGRFILKGGYYLSNLDYYSGRRNVTLANGQKFHVPQKELSQSIFLSIGYSFHHR
ncbi:MAG TPA: hypothetical protein H9807_02810 [Candidatus Bacteroides merdavium]|uniref:Outer membrane protein beta-barrel domain-containing protein n=1 Tax=Candidatus Bacteroides merdavium TaxID=2838472 RepID=A0A9D2KEG0_9BACE|nr:hypothetical protein [Candidatus Bacteroides merdavium]